MATNLPSRAIQATLIEWLDQVKRGEGGNPALLLTGLQTTAVGDRWDIGIIDAERRTEDPSKIVFKLGKPKPKKGKPQDEVAWTKYGFNQQMGWLLPVLAIYGNNDDIGVSASRSGTKANSGKPNGYYYATIKFRGFAPINVDRLTSGASAYQAARLANPRDYHNRTRENITLRSTWKIAEEFGPENARSPRRPLRTREDAIRAAVAQWREGGPFPSTVAYEEAIRFIFAVLDRGHPLAQRATTST